MRALYEYYVTRSEKIDSLSTFRPNLKNYKLLEKGKRVAQRHVTISYFPWLNRYKTEIGVA